MIYTSDLLLESIKTRAMIPSSQNTFQDSDLLNLANEEMETFIVGTLMRVQEEYLVITDHLPTVAGQARYRIPYRAIGQKIRDVTMTCGTSTVPIPRVLRENFANNNTSFNQFGFYIEGNYIVLLSPTVDTSSTIDVSYFMRPGKIVDSDNWQAATAVDTATNTLTVAEILPSFVVGAQLDIINANSGNETILRDAVITAVDSMALTITIDQSCALVNVSDYICLAGESAVPQCPEEMHPLLAQRVICRVLEALNDREGLAAASAKLKEMELNILALIDARVVGKPLKIVNRHGLLRSATAYASRFIR